MYKTSIDIPRYKLGKVKFWYSINTYVQGSVLGFRADIRI